MNGLKSYKVCCLDEKRTILSSLFSCYSNLCNNNVESASVDLFSATSLWGARESEVIKQLEYDIDYHNIGDAKDLLYKVIQVLIDQFSPSEYK